VSTTPTPAASDRGWPDPSRPGVPMNPDQDGWHILGHPDGRWGAYAWDAKRGTWWVVNQEAPPACIHGAYLGPCLTPAQHTAQVEQERAACAAIALRQLGGDAALAASRIHDAIRARGTTEAKDTTECQECGGDGRFDRYPGFSGVAHENCSSCGGSGTTEALDRKEAVVPERWELDAAAVFLDCVDDDETGSAGRVAAFLRTLIPTPASAETK
jgi:hypothetical protein